MGPDPKSPCRRAPGGILLIRRRRSVARGAQRARTISPNSTDDKRRRFSNTPRATHNKLTAARVVWPAGTANPLEAAAVVRGHSQEPLDDKCSRFSNTPSATHKKLTAGRAGEPAAEAAKPLNAAAVARGLVDWPVHPCRLRAGLQAVCAPSADFQS